MTNEKRTPAPDSLSPYELVFGSALFEADRFPAIRAEAEARGVETELPERFLLLGTVGALLQELLPEGAGSAEFSRHGVLLYQAYHFWRHGKRHYLLTEPEARELVDRPPEGERWHLLPPGPAGYLQLPRHLFWARIEEGATPEPVAGFFWTLAAAAPEAHPRPRLELLLALGLFPGRPGFSTITIETEIDRGDADLQPGAAARAEGEEFANILPGGELQAWYGLITELEVLKLVSRAFQQLAERAAGGAGDGR
jgi:hypothetical protein